MTNHLLKIAKKGMLLKCRLRTMGKGCYLAEALIISYCSEYCKLMFSLSFDLGLIVIMQVKMMTQILNSFCISRDPRYQRRCINHNNRYISDFATADNNGRLSNYLIVAPKLFSFATVVRDCLEFRGCE